VLSVEKPRVIQEIEQHCEIEKEKNRNIYKLPNTERVCLVVDDEGEIIIRNHTNISLLIDRLSEERYL
jgi:hypothetical protein